MQGARQRPHLHVSQIWLHFVHPGPKFLVHDWQSNTLPEMVGMVTYLVPNPALPAGTNKGMRERGPLGNALVECRPTGCASFVSQLPGLF